MRFEGNHQKVKKSTSPLSGTVNLKMTIAIKQSLKMCEIFNRLKNSQEIEFGSPAVLYEPNLSNSYKSVEISGVKYKLGTFIVIKIHEFEKEFGEITEIVSSHKEINFTVDIYKEITFNKHFFAYIVEKNPSESRVITSKELLNYPSCFCNVTDHARFITVKYRL